MRWQIGDVRVTRVHETDLDGFGAKHFFGVEGRDATRAAALVDVLGRLVAALLDWRPAD